MDPRTADPVQSIWRDLPEDTFREHLVRLEERTNAVPMDVQQFDVSTNIKSHRSGHLLSVNDEQGLANAFAFLVAVEEGAQSVAAVCLEEDVKLTTLTIRFAAVDAISEAVQGALRHVIDVLSVKSDRLVDSHLKLDELFRLVTKMHFRRILARLRSSKWTKPKFLSRSHKKPLWQDFANLSHRVQFLYTKRELSIRQSLEEQLENLTRLYSSFEIVALDSDEEFAHLIRLVRTSYDFCTYEVVQEYARRLENAGPTSQVRSALKTIRQIEKIAAYYRISNTLIRISRLYPQYFQAEKLVLNFLPPYASVPTSIGYEDWAKTCHVHAEIQLIVYYDMHFSDTFTSNSRSHDSHNANFLPPRVIGTSKYLCYLCYLFMKVHGRYPPANTHGRLYDQWTIPDCADFGDDQRNFYRYIIQQIDNEVLARASEPPLWRPEPMTSRENLLDTMGDESSTVLWRRPPPDGGRNAIS
ncbi:hypothetical protein G647_08769 [Cladophialophora carrionii CBS 160.54]|uniref:Uncharacterized protein n=1 Tax=Cladophialophora carrionii CBS 160.54 TaxID=1279043 RepID=V9CZC3_9EURO|nr:uncharacterized protein G647_08769 [Cladophialophora carrionii CBS 160.54]ETI19756.1 hypothetical protein G647_08769 [Cladophialophora carrionii CBS 160.54]